MCSVRTELYDTYIYRKIRIQIDLYRIPLKHDYTCRISLQKLYFWRKKKHCKKFSNIYRKYDLFPSLTCHRVNRKKLNIHTCENMRLDKQKKRNITYPVRSYETSPELPCWSGITSPVICLERISKATSAATVNI